MCEEYNSIYDIMSSLTTPLCASVDRWSVLTRGANNLQHQYLEEHFSTQCPLSYVD